MACDSFLTIGLLQAVNRFVASRMLKLVIHKLAVKCKTPDFDTLVAT